MEAFEISGKVDKDGKLLTTESLPFRNRKVRVLLMVEDELSVERDDWANTSMNRLNDAYGEDEPKYTIDMVKESNPNYQLG